MVRRNDMTKPLTVGLALFAMAAQAQTTEFKGPHSIRVICALMRH